MGGVGVAEFIEEWRKEEDGGKMESQNGRLLIGGGDRGNGGKRVLSEKGRHRMGNG